MNIKSFTPDSSWFFRHENVNGKGFTLHRLAGWALIDGGDGKGKVVGMVPVSGGGHEDSEMRGPCRLSPVPPVYGTYLHESELVTDK